MEKELTRQMKGYGYRQLSKHCYQHFKSSWFGSEILLDWRKCSDGHNKLGLTVSDAHRTTCAEPSFYAGLSTGRQAQVVHRALKVRQTYLIMQTDLILPGGTLAPVHVRVQARCCYLPFLCFQDLPYGPF